jgi:hypothetical protein
MKKLLVYDQDMKNAGYRSGFFWGNLQLGGDDGYFHVIGVLMPIVYMVPFGGDGRPLQKALLFILMVLFYLIDVTLNKYGPDRES